MNQQFIRLTAPIIFLLAFQSSNIFAQTSPEIEAELGNGNKVRQKRRLFGKNNLK